MTKCLSSALRHLLPTMILLGTCACVGELPHFAEDTSIVLGGSYEVNDSCESACTVALSDDEFAQSVNLLLMEASCTKICLDDDDGASEVKLSEAILISDTSGSGARDVEIVGPGTGSDLLAPSHSQHFQVSLSGSSSSSSGSSGGGKDCTEGGGYEFSECAGMPVHGPEM
jgi:hypothetical protein